MNKFLRFSCAALLAVTGFGTIHAQEVTIDFSGTTDNWGIGTDKLVEEKSFTYNGYTIKLKGTDGNGYRWYDSGNIILGKQGATLELPAFNFDVERIDIEGTSGASTGVKQNIFVGDEAVSTETTGAKNVTNQYWIAEGKQAAGTVYTLKVTSNHNTQITKIMIYKKGTAPTTPTVEVEQLSVAQALDIINALEDGKTTDETYQVKGFVVGAPDFQRKSDNTLYGNVNFDMADTKDGANKLNVFRAKSFEGAAFTEETISILKEGDEVVVEGKLQKFVKNDVVTPEVASGGIIISINGQTSGVAAVKADVDKNAPAYNMAGQRVSNSFKGLIIKGGKKLINK